MNSVMLRVASKLLAEIAEGDMTEDEAIKQASTAMAAVYRSFPLHYRQYVFGPVSGLAAEDMTKLAGKVALSTERPVGNAQ